MNLNGFVNINESTISNSIVDNLISLFDWGLINKDNFINVDVPSSGEYGGEDSTLSYIDDPRFINGQVWQAMRGNWVWETGLDASISPNVGSDAAYPGATGIYVNDTFYPRSTTGTYEYYLDHINGQVVFSSAIPITSSVECSYSYKLINVNKSTGLDWFKRIQKESDRSDKDQPFTLRDNITQLPVIGIELINDRSFQGYNLGGSSWVRTGVICHCIAESAYERDFLMDIVSYQNEKTFMMYDLNLISEADSFPIDHRGVPNSGALQYEELVSNYPYKALRLYDMSIDSIYKMGELFVGSVKCKTEVILGV